MFGKKELTSPASTNFTTAVLFPQSVFAIRIGCFVTLHFSFFVPA